MQGGYKMHSITVKLPSNEYPIFIESGLLEHIETEIKKLYTGKKIAIITDSNVDDIYGNAIEASLKKENFIVKKIIIKPGEKSKSFETLQRVCDEILEFEITRGDLILTFGGGVVGDLGGFAASILLRGIPFIQVPTSLLAQIDSSVGGKVAVNSAKGKNLIGSFYQPKAVFIDPSVLKTLSEKQFNDGLGEVIKYGAIKDKNLFDKLLNYGSKADLFKDIDDIIYTCCSIKARIVEQDEKDFGERMLLNFGHTIGHGIERQFNYETYTHGEAVSMGMCIITKNSERLGITEKGTYELLESLIRKYNLPYKLPDMNEEQILKAIKLDKKNLNDILNIILLEKIGCGFIKEIANTDIKNYINCL